MIRKTLFIIGTLLALAPLQAAAQMQPTAPSLADLTVLKGLAPVTILSKTPEGQAALAANYTVTGSIQTGATKLPTLLPFSEQQQQALRDAFITGDNLADLSDGLGTTLGAAYLARAHYLDRVNSTKISKAVFDLIALANATTGTHSNAAKYFFANETTDGKTPVSEDAMAILKQIGGAPDAFGTNYGLPAGAPGADAFGDSRPFQTEPTVSPIVGLDYFNTPANNSVYNRGPIMNLINSPSYPSGHTTYGYMGSILLAVLVPQRYQQMITRGAEYGNDRILMGAHYAMDVIAGRTLATYDLAHLLANDKFQSSVQAARTDLTAVLQAACGEAIQSCAREDTGRLSDPAANEAFYLATQTYNLPVVHPKTANRLEDVGTLAPEAGYLLKIAFPSLSLEQANRILTETEGPGGGFLDDGSSFGVYSRLNLYVAAARAATRSEPRP